MMSQPRRIYWQTPTVMVSAFAGGMLLVLGHHFFYYNLSGSIAPSESYHVLSETISRQQVNLAVGTSLAFMSKSLFSLAVTASYTQVFWRALRKAQYKARLTDIDVVFSVTQDILGLFRSSIWRRYSLLLTLAMIFWLLPIPFVITPATLTVQEQPNLFAMRSVPQFDFINPNFVDFYTDIDSPVFYYAGPSQLVKQIATTTAARGEILAITPPALNASWNLEFWGPSISCTNVSDPLREDILKNIGSYLDQFSYTTRETLTPYLSWAPGKDNLPFTNSVSGLMLQNLPALLPTVFLAYTTDLHDEPPSAADAILHNTSNVVNARIVHNTPLAWLQILSNYTILKCDLFNSSYTLHFQYTNGAQHIDVSKTTSSQNPLTSLYPAINLPVGPQSMWTDSPCNISTSSNISTSRPCFNQVGLLQISSYYAIFNALTSLLIGSVEPLNANFAHFAVSNTVLADTDELRYLSALNRTGLAVSPAFQDIPFQSPQGRGSLAKALEQLFENITISVLSEPYLQPNYSSSYPSLANVTSVTYRSVYDYDARTLWIAYGLAILFTAVTIVIGSMAMYSNEAAYDGNFSTVLRACRIQGKGVVLPAHTNHDSDDGSQPLPEFLATASIVMNASRQDQLDPNPAHGKWKHRLRSNSTIKMPLIAP